MDAESRLASSIRSTATAAQSFPVVAAAVPKETQDVTRKKAAHRSIVHIGAG
jgi:hypothetical protein